MSDYAFALVVASTFAAVLLTFGFWPTRKGNRRTGLRAPLPDSRSSIEYFRRVKP